MSADTSHIDRHVSEAVDSAIKEAIDDAEETPELYQNPSDIHIDDIVAEKLDVDLLDPSYMFDSLNAESFEEALEVASNAAAEHNATIIIGDNVESPHRSMDITPYTRQEYGAGSALNGLIKGLYKLPKNLLEDYNIDDLIINLIESADHKETTGFTQLTRKDIIYVTASTLEQSPQTNWQIGTTLHHEITHRLDLKTNCLGNDPQYQALERDLTNEMRENREGAGEIVFSGYGATVTYEDKAVASEFIYSGRKAPGVDNSPILEEKEAILYRRLHDQSPPSAEWFWYQSRYAPHAESLVEEHEAWQKYEEKNLITID